LEDDKMCNEKYNGWSNYPTWAVKLWMDHSEISQTNMHRKAIFIYKNAIPNGRFTKSEVAIFDLQAWLKSDYENRLPAFGSVWGDLLTYSLDMVDWHEIAKAIIDDEIDKTSDDD